MKRTCVRPACDRPAEAVMSYDYGQRSVWIDELGPDREPHRYELCGRCAERTTPPRGWVLTDARSRTLFEAVG